MSQRMPDYETLRARQARPQEGHVDASLLHATRMVLAERERELLALRGPCSNKSCTLHYAHYGPCL